MTSHDDKSHAGALPLDRLREALEDHERYPGEMMAYMDRVDTPEGEIIEAAKALLASTPSHARRFELTDEMIAAFEKSWTEITMPARQGPQRIRDAYAAMMAVCAPSTTPRSGEMQGDKTAKAMAQEAWQRFDAVRKGKMHAPEVAYFVGIVERVTHMACDEALEWAAMWMLNTAAHNTDPAVKEFASNMAMTIRSQMGKTIPSAMAQKWIVTSERLPDDDDFKSLIAVAEDGLIERESIAVMFASTLARHPNLRGPSLWTPLPNNSPDGGKQT